MNNAIYEFNKLNRKNKEDLLKYMLNFEMQEMQYNQEPVFAFPQKDD